MSMYLPNPDVRPTGYEACEFLDTPPLAPEVEPKANPTTPDVDDEAEDDKKRTA